MAKKKCTCGANNHISCPSCSAFKIYFGIKREFQHLFTDKDRCWYSKLKQDYQPLQERVDKLETAYLKSRFLNKLNSIIIYDNSTKKEVAKIRL